MSTIADPVLRPASLGSDRSNGIRVLQVDPELGGALHPEQWRPASQAAIAPALIHPPGDWRFGPDPDPAALGTLIVDGVLAARTEVCGRAHLELLGPGDLIGPRCGGGGDPVLPALSSARALSRLRLAHLDRSFSLRTARWPEIHAALAQRLCLRVARLSLQSAINVIPRVDERLEQTMWQLGSRFGRMTPAGIRLALRLTHTQLAEIVAAQRPSVTTALGRLESDGRVVRRGRDEWLLRGPQPVGPAPLERRRGVPA